MAKSKSVVNETEETRSSDIGITSFFSSFMPKEILGVPVQEIKKDINEGRSQISSL